MIIFLKKSLFGVAFLIFGMVFDNTSLSNNQTQTTMEAVKTILGVLSFLSGVASVLFGLGILFSVTDTACRTNLVWWSISSGVLLLSLILSWVINKKEFERSKQETENIKKQKVEEIEKKYIEYKKEYDDYIDSLNDGIKKHYDEFLNSANEKKGIGINEILIMYAETPKITHTQKINLKSGVCPTCGAPLVNGTCEYCKNHYESKEDVIILYYDKLMYGSKTYIFHSGVLAEIQTNAKPLSQCLLKKFEYKTESEKEMFIIRWKYERLRKLKFLA